MMSSEPRSVVGPSGHVTEVRLCSKTGVYACSKVRVHSCPQTFAFLLPAGGRSDDDLITASARPLEIPAPPHLAALK